ncbi:hypothetical protein K461DRAFT_229807 [Myriangium duriaei CBS 260.36]|uniref:Zn(2)-C6 fungal-type domain-containing protein n=1 Tax=Myriangium duriaei CBS 260.36 TaxID=1168546 RepID=A0A9P4MDQ6_9PEZI|nr:hypothetical protein K461DRAFT_229807 [Myriangium duriaei CBS 260.36]
MVDFHDDGEGSESRSPANSNHGSNDDTPAKKSAKDPSRPRRKKARRACFACQRAHLTCGDERPCLRCIKRGLQDQCHDGMRKKAKYLHDAPPEALVPGMGGSYNPQPGAQTAQQPSDSNLQNKDDMSPLAQPGGYFPVDLQQGASGGQNQSLQAVDPALDVDDFASYDRMGSISASQPQQRPGPAMRQDSQSYTMPFDPTDPHFFNFDISGLNFGNHYGALEFGMLGHMSSGAGAFESPDDSSLLSSMNYDSTTAGYSPMTSNFQYNTGNPTNNNNSSNFQNWPNPQQNTPRQNSAYTMPHHYDGHPAAFTIGEGTGSISSASPGNTNLDLAGHNSSPVSAAHNSFPQRRSQDITPYAAAYNSTSNSTLPTNPFAKTGADHRAVRRRRDPSTIYKSVKEPYSYTTGFHLLTAFVARRFSKDKTLRIAKSLASIRPSFISCTRELSRDDLIFMEKGFQRNLLLYDDYINAYGSPTLICRRTGEVAAVSKEFSLLTGWSRDVLLGKEPNLNVNYGTSASAMATGKGTGSSSRGAATPNKMNVEIEPGRPQPVFLAELLDDDTAVQFYEDFAKMAFGDSRGQVQRRGKLLKYKTKDDPGWGREMDELGASDGRSGVEKRDTDQNGHAHGSRHHHHHTHRLDKFGKGIDILGEKDGKVDVMFCHIVKRDTFDIPMMIIINVSVHLDLRSWTPYLSAAAAPNHSMIGSSFVRTTALSYEQARIGLTHAGSAHQAGFKTPWSANRSIRGPTRATTRRQACATLLANARSRLLPGRAK